VTKKMPSTEATSSKAALEVLLSRLVPIRSLVMRRGFLVLMMGLPLLGSRGEFGETFAG